MSICWWLRSWNEILSLMRFQEWWRRSWGSWCWAYGYFCFARFRLLATNSFFVRDLLLGYLHLIFALLLVVSSISSSLPRLFLFFFAFSRILLWCFLINFLSLFLLFLRLLTGEIFLLGPSNVCLADFVTQSRVSVTLVVALGSTWARLIS